MSTHLLSSFSRLQTLQSCSHLYWVKYKENYRPKSFTHFVSLGHSVHRAVEEFLKNKKAGTPLSVEEAVHIAIESTYEHLSQDYADGLLDATTGLALSKDKADIAKYQQLLTHYSHEIEAETNVRFVIPPENFYPQLKRCVENFCEFVKGHSLNFEVEKQFEVDLHGVLMRGSVDYILLDSGIIYDWKTGLKVKRKSDVANSDQLFTYAKLYKMWYDEDPKAIGFVNLNSNITYVHRPTEDDYVRYEKRMEQQVRLQKLLETLDYNPLPVAASNPVSSACPCDLAFEPEGSPYKCPYYKELGATYGSVH